MELTGALTSGIASFAVGTNGYLYFTNGNATDDVRRWSGAHTGDTASGNHKAGLIAPSSAPAAAGTGSGGTLTGEYKAYVRYKDSATGTYSSFNVTPVSLSLSENTGISYTSVPTSSEDVSNGGTKTVHREIWRNTHGQETTWYLDKTIADGTTTSATSTNTDAQLRASTALRLLTADGYPNAHRFGVPPDYMQVIIPFQDRLYFLASSNSTYKNTIMFSEADEPESVPSVNSLTMVDDGDVIVGGFVQGHSLYILKRNHVYRFSTSGDPRNDAQVSLVAERGACSQRCWTRVEGVTYLFDQDGPWIFDGSVNPIDVPIHDYITDTVEWDHLSTFSVAKDTQEQVVRFFFATGTDSYPKNALAFSYRDQKWYYEDYSATIYGSGEVTISGIRRTMIGRSDGVYLLNSGTYDASRDVDFELRLGSFKLLGASSDHPRRVRIYFDPTAYDAATQTHKPEMSLEYYLNHGSTAVPAAVSSNLETNATVTRGNSEVVFDMSDGSGWAEYSFTGGGDPRYVSAPKTIEFVLKGSAYIDMKIYRIEIDGVEL